jgi:hypothetical protein
MKLSRPARAKLSSHLPELLLVLALVIYPMLWVRAPYSAPDTGDYLNVAKDLADGTIDQLHFRAPGFPALLLLTNSSLSPNRALFIVQMALQLSAIYILVRVLRDLAIPAGGITILTLLLLSPPYMEPSAYALTEGLSGFLLVTAFGLTIARGNEVVLGLSAGAAIGLAALTRPTYQLLGLLLVPIVARYASWRRATALLVSSLALVVGFSVFNSYRFGYFGINPALGFNLSTKTVRFIERLPEGPVRELLIDARNHSLVQGESHTAYMYIWGLQPQLSAITGLQGAQLERYMMRLNLGLIKSAPLTYLQEVGWACASFWLPSSGDISSGGRRSIQALWAMVQLIVIALFWSGGVAMAGTAFTHGLTSPRRRAIFAYLIGFAIVLYTMLVSACVEIGNPRFRSPTESLIVLLAVLGIHLCLTEKAIARSEPFP